MSAVAPVAERPPFVAGEHVIVLVGGDTARAVVLDKSERDTRDGRLWLFVNGVNVHDRALLDQVGLPDSKVRPETLFRPDVADDMTELGKQLRRYAAVVQIRANGFRQKARQLRGQR